MTATTRGTAQELAESALADSRSEECIVIVDESSMAFLRWAGNVLTGNGFISARQVTVIAITDGAVGVASGDGAGLVRAAEQAARGARVAEDAFPLARAGMTADWAEPPPKTPLGGIGALARSLGSTFREAQPAGRMLYGYAEHQVCTTYLASSSGLRLRHVQPSGLVDLTARTPDQSAASWTGMSTTALAAADLAGLDRRLSERLSCATRKIELPAGRYEVLLSPSCVADLMLHLYDAAVGADARGGNSVFSGSDNGTRIGERLTGQRLTLYSDPLADGLECAPFVIARSSDGGASVFDNGLPLRATEWISDGVLHVLLHSSASARRADQPVTPRIGNLILDGGPGRRSLAEMVAGTERGLLLTSLWYLREIDPRSLLLTGLTRDGVYLIDGGEIIGAVPNFRFSESPVGMLARVSEAGRTEPTLPREWAAYQVRTAMPPLRVVDFTMSAVSRSV